MLTDDNARAGGAVANVLGCDSFHADLLPEEKVSIFEKLNSQNIILAFAVKGIFIVFGTMGMASMWEAVFADMGTALLAVANSTRIISKLN